MAKNGNRKTTIAIISLIVVVIAIIAGVIKGYSKLEAEVEHQEETHTAAVETIKAEGCLPARQSKTDIQLVQKDIEVMQKDIGDIKTGVNELLKR